MMQQFCMVLLIRLNWMFFKIDFCQGLGPKTASMILGRCKCNDLVVAIENGDVAF